MERPQEGGHAAVERLREGGQGAVLDALQAVIQELGRGADSGRMLEVVLDHVLRVVRGECGVIYTWDATAGALVPRAWRGVAGWIAGQRLKSGEGVAGAVAEHGEGLIVNDVPGSRFAKAVDCQEATLHALLAEPLGHRDRLLGVLVVGRKRAADPFGDADREAARLFATAVSLALEQARLVEELAAERHERQQAEADLLRWRRQVEAVSEIGDEVAREMDAGALMQLIATRVMVLLDAAGSALYLSEDEEEALVAKSAEGLLRPVLLERRRFGQGLVGTTAQSRQGIIANDYPHSAYLLPSVLESARVEAAMTEPLLFRGRLRGVVHVVRDASGGAFTTEDQYTLRLVAKQASLAIEHARLFTELNDAFAKLQVLQDEVVRTERLQTLGQLTSGTVFNLTNCLSIVVGQVEQLGLRSQDPRIQESLATMANAAMGAVGMVRRLQAFTAEKPGGGMEPCDLAGLVMEAASTTQPRWKDEAEREGRQIRVEVQLPELPAVLGRPGDLREVVTKLILHALEAMPDGGTITISGHHEPGFGDDERDGWVVLTVRDTGFGMPEYLRARIFDPVIGDPTLRGRQLGLATVAEVVHAHGGRIGVTSVPTEGTTFTIRLKATGDRPLRKAEETALPLVTGRRILVVDDNPEVLATQVDLLEGLGQVVLAADGGRTALRMLEEGPIDLVITDLGMPGLNGWEVAEAIKAKWPFIPVVLLTGWGDQAVQAETRRHAFVSKILYKPASRKVLQDVIAALAGPAAV